MTPAFNPTNRETPFRPHFPGFEASWLRWHACRTKVPNEGVMLFHVTLVPNEGVMLFHVTLAGLITENHDTELVRGPACSWLATHLKMGSPRYLSKLVCFAIQR